MAKRRLPSILAVLFPAFALGAPAEFHVAPGGADENPGTRERPFRTLARARDAIRTLKGAQGLPAGGVTVWIAGGTYAPAAPIDLGPEDAGTPASPITYRAREGEIVRLAGGIGLSGWRPVADPKMLDRLDPSARGKVVEIDLGAAGIRDLGTATGAGTRAELFFRDQPMTLARWPNEGFARIADLAGAKPMQSHGIPGNREGKLVYDGDRPRRWIGEDDVWLHGYWFWDWSDAFQKVESIDPEERVIATVPPYHHYGYRKGQRFYALNVLAELDSPGEWYIDRRTGILYFWPPAPVEEARAVVSVLPSLFRIRDASWVTIRGVILEATRSTAVTIQGGARIRVAGCRIRNTGAWGVTIGGGTDHAVEGCDILRTGEGGVSLSGGDRRTLTPSRHAAIDNHIHHFARIQRTYRPAVGVQGVGQRVAHNRIHDAPHNGILLGGNDHVIEFNEIHDVCFETGDVGAFYMGRDWTARGTIIRHNHFHDIRGPGLHGAMAVYLDDSASGIAIIGNLFVRAARAAFIGGGRDNLVEGNIFVDCETSVHVDARGVGWMRSTVETTLPERLRAVPYRTPPWSERYPQLLTILEDEPGLPKGNVVRRNISTGGRWTEIEKVAQPLVAFEDNLVDVDPKFVDRGKGDFRLRDDSPAFAKGFRRIPIAEIGPRNEGARASLPEEGR
ncbi:MAG: right-handed parallel beta-helix repeat-containing protein [Planctomycetes bacterium]|nr:right-handed parallel beta-helix repeat-containing protein [Planctomycetota bacterium]